MSGYQESVSDPSYRRQIITFTYPHVGNYGVSAEAMESGAVHARGVIMRAAVDRADAPGAEGGEARERVPAGEPMDGLALAPEVRPSEPVLLGQDSDGPRVVAIDTG